MNGVWASGRYNIQITMEKRIQSENFHAGSGLYIKLSGPHIRDDMLGPGAAASTITHTHLGDMQVSKRRREQMTPLLGTEHEAQAHHNCILARVLYGKFRLN